MQDGRKEVLSIPYVSMAFFPSLKQNFITYRSSKVSSRPDCIFEIHLNLNLNLNLNLKIGQSSRKMYSNNILDFQEYTTILNACTKKSGNLLKAPRTWTI